ncbi:RING finger protein 223 [Pseudoliparis swirei]|uniref:RING finger protein 223 n=1 Tax=Pseudoliparis swirei TaxID=2059687 RepID=UPI0024BD8D4B|nr:RING finger protein 223 [Pseudoliparis swirei]
MERSPQNWSTRLGSGAEEPKKEASDTRRPECSICYDAYDNVFKTPNVLECTHTFCLECLSRLAAVARGTADGRAGARLSCPFCRHATALPEGGPPALTTGRELLRQLPGPQRREEPVWLEGEKLCCKSADSAGAPEGPEAVCICIDIGADRTPRAGGAPIPTWSSIENLLPNMGIKSFLACVALLLLILLFVIFHRPQGCVEPGPTTTPTTTPAHHEARPPRGPPATRRPTAIPPV